MFLSSVALLSLPAVSGGVSAVAAADTPDCVSTFAGSPPGPEAPANVRVASQGIAQSLAWDNKAQDAKCIVVQFKPLTVTGGQGAPQDWATLVTLTNVQTTSYQLPPIAGQVCYRLYAANAQGRSDFSEERCVAPAPVTLGPALAGQSLSSTTGGTGAGGSALPAVIIIVAALAAAAVAAMLVLRWRVANKG